MPGLPSLIHGTGGAWAHRSHPWSLHLNAVDLIDLNARGHGVPLESISISENGANGASTMQFTVQDPRLVLTLPSLSEVHFTDETNHEVNFAGYLVGRRLQRFSGKRGYQAICTAVDYGYLLDTTILPAIKHGAGASDRTLIQSVVGHSIRHKNIHTHTSLVTSTNSNMPAMDFTHLTLRAAIEAIAYNAGEDRHYYPDFLGRLHYYQGPTESGMGTAPYTIVESASLGAGERAAEGLELEFDASQLFNAVLVVGQTAAGTGWVKNETSIKQYGLREGIWDALHSVTAAQRTNVGNHFLARHKDELARGSYRLTGSDAGWRVGQTVTITSAGYGITAATYPIKQIDTVFKSGTGVRERTIYFGELPASGRRVPHNGGGGTHTSPPTPPPHHAQRILAHTAGVIGLARNTDIN